MASKELLLKDLDANGKHIENLGVPNAALDATYTELTTPALPVGTTNAPGTSFIASAEDHTHEGVHGVKANGGTVAVGDVNLVDGSGITITKVGNDFTIAQSSGSTNKITGTHDGAAYSIGVTEEIIREFYVNFDDAPGATIKAMLAAIVKSDGTAVATYNLRTGATAPGSTAGSTVRATITTTSATEVGGENLGSSFANPTGNKFVQITAQSDTALIKSYIRGINFSIG